MHHLFAVFIRDTRLTREEQAALEQVGAVRAKRFVELAGYVAVNPADLKHVLLFLDYPLAPEIWDEMGASFSLVDGRLAGRGLYELERFEEARPWCERAVAEAKKGDVHGRGQEETVNAMIKNLATRLRALGRSDEADGCEQRGSRAPAN